MNLKEFERGFSPMCETILDQCSAIAERFGEVVDEVDGYEPKQESYHLYYLSNRDHILNSAILALRAPRDLVCGNREPLPEQDGDTKFPIGGELFEKCFRVLCRLRLVLEMLSDIQAHLFEAKEVAADPTDPPKTYEELCMHTIATAKLCIEKAADVLHYLNLCKDEEIPCGAGR